MSQSQPVSNWLVTTDWLAERLGAPDIAVLDGSYYLGPMNRDAEAEYLAGHIPGALRFNIDKVADTSTGLPHMVPSPEVFAQAVGAMGVGNDDTVVVYDGLGMFSSPRVWWTFRLFGHDKVRILEGGMPKWKEEGRPVDSGAVSRPATTFRAKKPDDVVADLAKVQRALADKSAQVVEARPAERFRGQAPEPRPGIRSGHIPGSLSVPFTQLVENGRLLPPEKLRAAFKAGGVDIDQPIITACGSGVSAAAMWLALDALGKSPHSLYDGSWTEWGGRSDLPLATGPK